MTDNPNQSLPQDFLDKLNSVKNKRARIVIKHILKHGSISTEELKTLYGYDHPPRAAKDARDEGIPLETFSIKSTDGRSIAAYRFGDPLSILKEREGGRKNFSKRFKQLLYQQSNGKCAICNQSFSIRELQVDHRIPYAIDSDPENPDQHPEAYMLTCGSCNRAKSWSCEHCDNWQIKDITLCANCYWANPLDYEHVATKKIKRTDIAWEGDEEIEVHEKIHKAAVTQQLSIQAYIKRLLRSISFLVLLFILIAVTLFFVREANSKH